MIHDELKKLRKERDLTLKVLSSNAGYGTGNLSSYENGKLKPRDKTLLRILTRGFGMTMTEANARIALWRRGEFEEVYKVQLGQMPDSYNPDKTPKTLDEYLKSEGLDKESIKKIKKAIQSYKKKSHKKGSK